MASDKYLFFYLKTGGGHFAPAKAVSEKIMSKSKKKSDIEILLVDGLSGSNIFVRKTIEDGYKTAVNRAVWTFEFIYAIHKIKIISRITAFIVSYFVRSSAEKQILQSKPKKIVVFHFLLIKPIFEIIKKHNLDIPVITVVTDPFTAHPIWFLQEGQRFIVFSEMLKEKCIRNGIDEENLRVFPFVIDRKFSQKITKSAEIRMRRKLGFEPDSKIILIMGGGDGMPHGKKILKNIILKNINAEIAVVCGKNQTMYEHVTELKEKYGIRNLKIYGFVDFVHSLINISEVVITKCGASTFMEILLLGKVPLINNYVWEQEKGNVEFICNGKMGIMEKNTKRIPDVLEMLLTDGAYYSSLVNNIKKASITNGVGQVSDYILNFHQ